MEEQAEVEEQLELLLILNILYLTILQKIHPLNKNHVARLEEVVLGTRSGSASKNNFKFNNRHYFL